MDAGHGRPFHLDASLAVALCGGVMLQLYWPALLPAALALAALGLAAVALALPALRGHVASRTLAIAMCGGALCALHGHAALSMRLPPELDGRLVVVEARVLGLPAHEPRGSRFAVEVVRVLDGAPGIAGILEGRRLDVRWYGGGRALRPGEHWRWSLRLGTVRGPMNPGDADPSRRALVERAAATARVLPRVRPLRLSPGGGRDALRDGLSGRIASTLGVERARFVAALAVGDTRGLSDGDWERLRRFGLTHLIAISGFHVGLVAGFGVFAVRGLWWLSPTLAHRWRRPQAAAVGATVVATGYAALAGFSLPTVRTVLMVAAVAAAVALRRRTPPAQGLLLAVVLIVLVDPFSVLTPGFWLSCGGVAWLMWCLPTNTRGFDVRAFLSAQWIATLALLPIAAAFFLQVPVAGPLANLVAIPWISLVVVPLSLLGTLAAPASEPVAAALWSAAAGAMDLLWQGLGAVPEVLGAVHWVAVPSAWVVGLAVLGVAVALLPRGVPGRHAGWLLLLPLLAPRWSELPHGGLRLTAFALPRGDAVLVQTASHNVLVDAGPTHADLAASLRAMGVAAIDLRIETRRNAGRAGGIAALDAALPPREVWQGPAGPDGGRCEAGRRWAADGVLIDALSPLPDGGGREPDHACVLRITPAQGHPLWLASEAGPWVAHRLVGALAPEGVAPAAAWIIGSPASLDAWRVAFAAEGAIATRAPGPSRSRRWPADLRRVDLEGALQWSSPGTGGSAAATVHRATGPRRWWQPAAR